ncbi:amino acid adenylation domain-containing protein [Streptomyces sp. NPDC127108]|uniref:amino acid adenylation domain-containing protein n=1 Tax=Streptomyces sp. NPDC127108 TaxID=3345361 RepID=UPI003634D8C6
MTTPDLTGPARDDVRPPEPVREHVPPDAARSIVRAVVRRAVSAPGDVALVEGGRSWTYAELERASAVVAARLRESGVGAESVVGLCLPRGGAMAVAMLGVSRAGGAWLALDPSYPVSRLGLMVGDAGCSVVVRGAGERAVVEGAAGDGVVVVELEDLDLAGEVDRSGLDAAAEDDLAYLVFTSGSTGRPKGVAVTHGQLATHLTQLVGAFGLTAGERVLVFGSFSFDVSTEQLFAPLTVGGAAVIRPDGLLGTEELLAFLAEHGVGVFNPPTGVWRQMAAALADGAAVPPALGIRLTVVGGDAMPAAETGRWGRAVGGRIINAYGPTEAVITATAHEITGADGAGAEPSGVVPLGRPLPGRTVHVLDGALRPVAAGSVGELFIGGAGVARGYAGRGGLTAERFVPDPFSSVPGARLYRSGDLVRSGAAGVLEFQGRADEQVKVRGFRMELGEIEAVLRAAPGITDSVVTALAPPAGGEPRLVGYVVARAGTTCDPETVRAWTAQRLPAHMVPAAVMALDALPLSPNGKVDRDRLPEPQGERAASEPEFTAPRNRAEEVLAEVWSDVLGVDRVGIDDNYFALGGDSILAIRMLARARKAGVVAEFQDLVEHQTIRALAEIASQAVIGSADARHSGGTTDALSPIQRWFHELDLRTPAHWNMGLLLAVRRRVLPEELSAALDAVADAHEALRTRFVDGDPVRAVADTADVPLEHTDLSSVPADEVEQRLRDLSGKLHTGLDPARGPLLRAHLADLGPQAPQRLVLAAHHLVMDAVSWRIVLEDLEAALDAVREGRKAVVQPEGTTHRQWTAELRRRALDPRVLDRVRAELGELTALAARPGQWETGPAPGTEGGAHRAGRGLSAEETTRIQQALVHRLGGSLEEGLLTATARARARVDGLSTVVMQLESHGRADLRPDLDLSRTVGWFTALAPFPVAVGDQGPLGTLWEVRARLRELVHRGLDSDVVRYLSGDAELAGKFAALPAPHLTFNHLGRVSSASDPEATLELLGPGSGPVRDPRGTRPAAVVVESLVTDGCLTVEVEHTGQAAADALVDALLDELRALAAEPEVPALASGLRQGTAPVTAVRACARSWGDLTAVWPLTQTQEGMFFRSLAEDGAAGSGVYVEQLVCVLDGDLDQDAFVRAWQAAVDRHGVLRGGCVWRDVPRPLFVVPAVRELPVTRLDFTDAEDADARLDAFVSQDRKEGFDLSSGPLVRLAVARLAPGRWAFVWTNHHVLFDGWSLPILLGEVLDHYVSQVEGRARNLPTAPDFGAFARWIARQDPDASQEFWTRNLAGFAAAPIAPQPNGPARHRDHLAQVSAGETTRLQETAQRLGVTLGGLVHTAWAVTLAVETDTEDVAFGSVGSGRPAELDDVERMVGMFINTVPLRIRLPAALPVGTCCKEVQHSLRQAQEHIHTPLARIARWSGRASSSELFDTSVIVSNFPVADLVTGLPGLSVARAATLEQTELPVTLSVASEGDRLAIALNHDAVRVSPERAADLVDLFRRALTALADDTATVGEVCAGLREHRRDERAASRARRAARLTPTTRRPG